MTQGAGVVGDPSVSNGLNLACAIKDGAMTRRPVRCLPSLFCRLPTIAVSAGSSQVAVCPSHCAPLLHSLSWYASMVLG